MGSDPCSSLGCSDNVQPLPSVTLHFPGGAARVAIQAQLPYRTYREPILTKFFPGTETSAIIPNAVVSPMLW